MPLKSWRLATVMLVALSMATVGVVVWSILVATGPVPPRVRA